MSTVVVSEEACGTCRSCSKGFAVNESGRGLIYMARHRSTHDPAAAVRHKKVARVASRHTADENALFVLYELGWIPKYGYAQGMPHSCTGPAASAPATGLQRPGKKACPLQRPHAMPSSEHVMLAAVEWDDP